MDAQMKAIELSKKLQTITDEVLVRNIGRQDLIRAVWAGLISGRPVFALGPTGVNKTGTIRQMAQRINGAIFDERLIPAVKSAADLFVESTEIVERQVDGGKAISLKEKLGRAALAHIFFGDEFFKDEDHPVLNALIDYALEGVVRHEGGRFVTPLQLFVAAGNEVPDAQGRLAAVWSRMTIRLVVKPLDRGGKKLLVASRTERQQEQKLELSDYGKSVLTLDDVILLREQRTFVEIPEPIIETVLDIVDELSARTDADFSNLVGDDRRFGRIFDVMQALALIDGRDTITTADLSALRWMLWDDESQIPVLTEILAPYTRTALSEAQELVNALLSPSGAVEASKSGDVTKGVSALSQCQAAIVELGKLIAEDAKVEPLRQQVQEAMQEVIKRMTGQK